MTSPNGQQITCCNSLLNCAINISKLCVEHMNGIQLSHIFEIPTILSEEPSISNENLYFDRKTHYFKSNFEIRCFSHTEFEILGYKSEISSISKKV